MPRRPRLVLLVNRPNWAYDYVARSLKIRLSNYFDTKILYANQQPDLTRLSFDLLYVFHWADRSHRDLEIDRNKVVVEVASLRWKSDGDKISTEVFVKENLCHCGIVTTPCRLIKEILEAFKNHVFLVPNGFEESLFNYRRPRTGPLTIGWVGRPSDRSKGLQEFLIPACQGRFNLMCFFGFRSTLPSESNWNN